MFKTIWAGYAGAFAALGVGTCCVMPMTLMLLGLGGSWLAIFGTISAASYYVLVPATLLVLAGWIVARQRHAIAGLKWSLTGSTALTAAAWVIVLNEARINDYLITLM